MNLGHKGGIVLDRGITPVGNLLGGANRTGGVRLGGDIRIADAHLADHRMMDRQADALLRNQVVLHLITTASGNALYELLHSVLKLVRGRDPGVLQPPVQVHLPVEAVDEGKVRLRGKVDAKGCEKGKGGREKG